MTATLDWDRNGAAHHPAAATPILHASAAAQGERRRRVLQVDYAATALPVPLVWLGL